MKTGCPETKLHREHGTRNSIAQSPRRVYLAGLTPRFEKRWMEGGGTDMLIHLGCSYCRLRLPNALHEGSCKPDVGFVGTQPLESGWRLCCTLHARNEASEIQTLDFTLGACPTGDVLPGVFIRNWHAPSDILFVRRSKRFLGSVEKIGWHEDRTVPGARLGHYLVFGDARGSRSHTTIMPLVHLAVTLEDVGRSRCPDCGRYHA